MNGVDMIGEGTFDYSQIDAGVRDVVRLLRDAGFCTCDSGDGSKAATMDGALDYPHVFMVIDAADAVSEVARCQSILDSACLSGWDAVARIYPDGGCLLTAAQSHEPSEAA